MPQFYGYDYYFQIISDHTAHLNRSVLAVPQNCNKYLERGSTELDLHKIWDSISCEEDLCHLQPTDCVEEFVKNMKITYESRWDTYEAFDEEMILKCFGEEIIEVVPSSNPASDGTFDENDIHDSFYQRRRERLELEHFTTVPTHEVSHEPFEYPLADNESKLSIARLPSVIILVSRIQAVELDDPLFRIYGSSWDKDNFMESDIEDGALQLKGYLREKEVPKEQFLKHLEEKSVNYRELLLSPSVPRNISLSDREDLGEMKWTKNTAVQEELDLRFPSEEDSIKDVLINKKTCEESLSTYDGDTDYGNRNCESLLHLCSFGLSPQSDANDKFILTLSPLLEPQSVEVDHGEDDNQVLHFPFDLEHFIAEEFAVKDFLLAKKELKLLERHIWEREKHFDEVQILEPALSQESLPDPVCGILSELYLQQEKIDSDNFTFTWSFDQPAVHGSESEIACLQFDVQLRQPERSEYFEKISASELDEYNMNRKHEIHDVGTDFQHVPKQDNVLKTNIEVLQPYVPLEVEKPLMPSQNPLDAFIHVRSKLGFSSNALDSLSCETVGTPNTTTGHKTKESLTVANMRTEQHIEVKTVEVAISGPFEEMVMCIEEFVGPHIDAIKQQGLVQMEWKFESNTADSTKFLLKEYEKKPNKEENLKQNLRLLHVMRKTADLILNACLDSALAYLSSQSEDWNEQLGNTLDEVQEQLLRFYYKFIEKDIMHPKFNVLEYEIGKFFSQHPRTKILVFVQRGLCSLISAILNLISRMPNVTSACLKDFKLIDLNSCSNTVYIAQLTDTKLPEYLSTFSLIVEYDELMGSLLKSFCKDESISYLGLISHLSSRAEMEFPTPMMDKLPPVTVICSTAVTGYRHLLYVLEARHNVLVIERDYLNTKFHQERSKLQFADVIISVTHCVVLLPLQEMGQSFNLEKVVKRFIGLGLQFSRCFIVVHAIGVTRYSFDNETDTNFYKLCASLSNLSRTFSPTEVDYKVLLCITEEDVALSVRKIICNYISFNSETDVRRSWLLPYMSKEEECLLHFTCLNSLSAQMLLRRFIIDEIWTKSEEDIRRKVPEIPSHIVNRLHHISSNLRQSQQNMGKSSVLKKGGPATCRLRSSTNNSNFGSTCYSDITDSDTDKVGHVSIDRNQQQQFYSRAFQQYSLNLKEIESGYALNSSKRVTDEKDIHFQSTEKVQRIRKHLHEILDPILSNCKKPNTSAEGESHSKIQTRKDIIHNFHWNPNACMGRHTHKSDNRDVNMYKNANDQGNFPE